jgi:hypothetical protein
MAQVPQTLEWTDWQLGKKPVTKLCAVLRVKRCHAAVLCIQLSIDVWPCYSHLYWFFITALLLLFWYIHKLTVFLRLLFHSIKHNFEQKQWKSTRQFVLGICTFTKAQIALCPFEVTKESNFKTIDLLIMYEHHYQYIMFSYIKNYTAILLLTYKTLTFKFSTLH